MPDPASTGEIDRERLVRFLDELLDAGQGEDYCPNGLQVEGRSRISRIVTGVSACLELFQIARRSEAQAVLVHHGIFWKGDASTLTGLKYRRVAELIHGELNLLAYHLPLDRHLEVGNNAVAARRLALEEIEPFCEHEGFPVGVAGRFAEPMDRQRVFDRLAKIFGQRPLVFPHGSDRISTVALVSGAAGRCFHAAIQGSIDLFVTGEAEESTMNLAKEAGVNFAAAGHYATERLGVQALGERLIDEFGIEVEFVDLPNPV